MFPFVLLAILLGGVAIAAGHGGRDPSSKLPTVTELPTAEVVEFAVDGVEFAFWPDLGDVLVVDGNVERRIGTATSIAGANDVAASWLDDQPIVIEEPPQPSATVGLIYEAWLDELGRMWDADGNELDSVVPIEVCAGDVVVLHLPVGASENLESLRGYAGVGEAERGPVTSLTSDDRLEWEIVEFGDGASDSVEQWRVGAEQIDPDTYEVLYTWGFDLAVTPCVME